MLLKESLAVWFITLQNMYVELMILLVNVLMRNAYHGIRVVNEHHNHTGIAHRRF